MIPANLLKKKNFFKMFINLKNFEGGKLSKNFNNCSISQRFHPWALENFLKFCQLKKASYIQPGYSQKSTEKKTSHGTLTVDTHHLHKLVFVILYTRHWKDFLECAKMNFRHKYFPNKFMNFNSWQKEFEWII